MPSPMRLRSTATIAMVLGATLVVISLLIAGTIPQDPFQMAAARFADPYAFVSQATASTVLFWVGVIGAGLGVIFWIVGYLGGNIAGSASTGSSGTPADWTFRRIGGKPVYLRRNGDGKFEVGFGGKISQFASYEELVTFVRENNPEAT